VLQAVDDYQDLLRVSVATAGNDHRLGAHEAPPAVVSIFLGDELTGILEAIENDSAYEPTRATNLKLGVHVLPRIPKDNTDRNRTSPFAFTGNKFEFRMLGSANSIAGPNIMINTAVAESLRQYADRLENAENFNDELHDLIKDVVKKHKRIIFNGNGYDDRWIREATEERGLLNLKTTPDALLHLADKKNLELFERHNVFTEAEVRSRYDILMDNYCKVINIEALTMIDMVRKEILPAVCAYQRDIAETAMAKKRISDALDCTYEEKLIGRLSRLTSSISEKTDEMEDVTLWLKEITDMTQLGNAYKDMLIPKMEELRAACDEAEGYTAENYWPFPTYGELLFGVR
jgi:glutamine synthetase